MSCARGSCTSRNPSTSTRLRLGTQAADWAVAALETPGTSLLARRIGPVYAIADLTRWLAALTRMVVWHAERVPQARSRLADTTVASVPTLTGELSTIVPYELAWQWADAFDAVGRRGISYQARFALDESVALFGSRDVPDDPPPAEPAPALDHYDALPPGLRAGVGTVGAFHQLDRAPPP